LETTKGKLERSLGDMNVMSGLIAHKPGRPGRPQAQGPTANYYEFSLQKSKTAPPARRPGADVS